VIPEWLQLLGSGGLGALALGVLVFIATRKKDVATDNKDRFQTSLDIAELVRSEVQKATQPLMERIQKLETGVLTSRTILYAHYEHDSQGVRSRLGEQSVQCRDARIDGVNATQDEQQVKRRKGHPFEWPCVL